LEGSDKHPEDVATLTGQVAGIVKRQRDLGIDCVGDGEFWTGRNFRFYGQQLSGITSRELRPGERASGRESTRERGAFPKLYADMDRVGTVFCVPGEQPRHFPATDKMVATGPIKGRATDAIRREITVFKEALAAVGGVEEAFICVFAPGWLDHFIYDEYYNNDEEFVFALAEAMREEYRAVVDAGFILQIDDPGMATSWDMINPALTTDEYRSCRKRKRGGGNRLRARQPRA
jgi:5-methyltetrahydropteroyltriglutamate--homocysteine methyltransferase